jgi:hypothetical protein
MGLDGVVLRRSPVLGSERTNLFDVVKKNVLPISASRSRNIHPAMALGVAIVAGGGEPGDNRVSCDAR